MCVGKNIHTVCAVPVLQGQFYLLQNTTYLMGYHKQLGKPDSDRDIIDGPTSELSTSTSYKKKKVYMLIAKNDMAIFLYTR